MKKAKSTWVGPEGKTSKSIEESNSSHSSQNQIFSMEQLMVSPLLGPAMPFQDATYEDLQILDHRPSTSLNFGILEPKTDVQSGLQLKASNAQANDGNRRALAYFASEANRDASESIHSDYLKTLNLMINEELRILCCEICQIAIPPETAKTHIANSHPNARFDAVKFSKAREAEGIRSDLPVILDPRPQVKGLAVHDAISCGQCNKVLVSNKCMREHHSQAHKDTRMPQEWRACKAQQFRRGGPGTHQMYWEVQNHVETGVHANGFIRAILKEMEEVLRVVEAPEDKRMVSPWLLTTGWHKHLAGQKTEDLMDLIAIPKKNDAEMPLLQERVESYYESVLALLSTTDELTLQRLNSPDPAKERTREMHDMTEALSMSLEEGLEEETVSSCIHALLMSAWTTKWKQTDENPIGDPTELCLALLTAQRDGSFKEPKDVTGIIAKDEYCMQASFIKEIRDQVEEGIAADENAACDILEPWFTEKRNSTFSRLRSLQHRASSIAFSTRSLPRIWWTDSVHWRTMLYKGNRIDLDDVCRMFAKTEEKLVEIWETMVLKNIEIRIDYEFLADDPTNRNVGYSFLTDERNECFSRRDRLLEAFFNNEKILEHFAVVGEGELIWNRGKLIEWLQNYTELHSLILLRCEMLSGSPGRGTELTAMMYRNTSTRTTRNLVILGNHVTMLCRYSKTSTLTGQDKLIPHSLDAVTSDILIQDLALARPFAEFAAHICFPDDKAMKDRYRNQLFVNFKKSFDSTNLSTVMTRYSVPHLSYGLTINSWRHIQTAWKRKFKCSMEDLLEEDAEDDVDALQAGHSRRTENHVYGLSVQAIAGAAEDVLPLFLNASTTWQTKCKTVAGGQLLPYHEARSIYFAKMQQISEENKRAPANSAAQMGSPPASHLEACSIDNIAKKVVDRLAPVLTLAIQAAVQEAIARQSESAVWQPVRMESHQSKHANRTLCSETLTQRHQKRRRLSVPPHRAQLMKNQRTSTEKCERADARLFQTWQRGQLAWNQRTSIEISERTPISDLADTRSFTETEALQAMRKLLHDDSASWKSEQQKEAMRVVSERKKDAIVVLRTGGGKSMLAIVPSLLEKNSATVLVLPLNSLLMDFQRRLTSMGVPFQTYDRNVNDGDLNIRDNLILVTADKARSARFREALAILNEKKSVGRMVFDESHLPLIAKDYRDALEDVYDLRSIPMQIICLSATLPPSCIADLILSFGLVQDTVVIRECTNREEIEYILEKPSFSETLTRAFSIVEEEMQSWRDKDRGLVFVPALSLGERLKKENGWPFYHGNQEDMTDEERRETYHAWVRGDHKIMLATTAFGTGNDYPHVRLVMHLNRPFEMLEFIQAQGRAGRDGLPAKAYVLVPINASPPRLPDQESDHKGKQAMYDHLYKYGLKRCLRYGMTQHIDGVGTGCRQLVSNQHCCVCKKDQYHDPASIIIASMPKSKLFVGSVLSKRPASPTFTFRPAPAAPHTFSTASSQNPFLAAANSATKMRTAKQQSKSELALQMRKALESLQDTCSLCAAMGSKDATPHMIHQCPFFGPHSEVEYEQYWEWRTTLKYLKYHKKICFVCHVPQINDDLHPTFGKDCEFKDIIAPAAFGVFCNQKARTAAETHFKQRWSDLQTFAGWLMGRPEKNSQSNLMDLFMWFSSQ
ncbi:hypothetical protein BDR06DRAFT_1000782 [Suillus hirtellus]|nr:hypothetical protein BDR06DRAFT_1000782 [Suillus hirtellus]